MTQVLDYVELRLPQLQALPRERTVFLVAVSPVEVHGPHLPTGTDVFVSLELQRRYIEALSRRHPDLVFVKLPPLFLGSDALPVAGSLSVPAPHLEGVLLAYARGLARQGFRYLFIADNHGGPRHQMATATVARRAWRQGRFYVINPFEWDYRRMVQHDPEFQRLTGLGPGRCGDDADNHAGTNETSLLLAVDRHSGQSRVAADYGAVPPSLLPPRRGAAAFLGWWARCLRRLGARQLAADLDHLANTLAWVGDPHMLPYMGAPGLASVEAGEAMLAARTEAAVQLFERALASQGREPVFVTPMLWFLRFLRRLPE